MDTNDDPFDVDAYMYRYASACIVAHLNDYILFLFPILTLFKLLWFLFITGSFQ